MPPFAQEGFERLDHVIGCGHVSGLQVRPDMAAGRYGDTRTWRKSLKRASSSLAFVAFPGPDLTDHLTVRGPVIEVPVKPNAPLKKGDVLFRIDPRSYGYALQQKRAALAEAEQTVKQLGAAADVPMRLRPKSMGRGRRATVQNSPLPVTRRATIRSGWRGGLNHSRICRWKTNEEFIWLPKHRLPMRTRLRRKLGSPMRPISTVWTPPSLVCRQRSNRLSTISIRPNSGHPPWLRDAVVSAARRGVRRHLRFVTTLTGEGA